MKVIQVDKTELPTVPMSAGKVGLLINVHLSARCDEIEAMRIHASDLLRRENLEKYARVAVVFWFQEPGRRERLYVYEVAGQK